MRLAALALLLVLGCGKAPVAVDLTPHVEFALASLDVPAGESIPVVITNRSSVPIYLMDACAPALEVSSRNDWSAVELRLVCMLDVRVPQQLGTGESTLRTIITRHATDEALPSGTYRAEFRLSGPEMSFATWYTPQFRLR